jgi:RNA polymerase sigma-70 factor (ECF subfamily)
MRAGQDGANGVGQDVRGMWSHTGVDSAEGAKESPPHRFFTAAARVDTLMTMPKVGTAGFEEQIELHRRELLAYCYRMTGSLQDAEDLLQETDLRAWRGYERFEGRSSLRTWLYRIATNVCLTAVERRRRRPLPSGFGPSTLDPYAPARPGPPEVAWLEPVPDRLVVDERGDPAEVVAARHRVRLALVAGMQVLPPRQRAAFIVCDVLSVPAVEAAEMLGVSVAAVKSLLQRARGRLAEVSLTDDQLAEPTDNGARQVLDRYLAAFESSDLAEMERLLADEAVLEMTGTTSWYSGKATCVPFIATQAIGRPGDWRMLPLRACGQLAAGAYHRQSDQAYLPFAVVVLATTSTQITRISLFAQSALFPSFDIPPRLA